MTKPIFPKQNSGFTLIEILVVIGIIAILATVVLIAINPARQFAQGRNSQRVSNVNALLNGYGQRLADNKGVFAGPGCTDDIPGTAVDLASAVTMSSAVGVTNYNVRPCLVPTYIPELPVDPQNGTACADALCAGGYGTGYKIFKDANGRVTVFAPSAELGATISVTR